MWNTGDWYYREEDLLISPWFKQNCRTHTQSFY